MTTAKGINLDRISKIAMALTPENTSVFDRSIGKDENCLSPRKIVSCLQAGATSEDLVHLRACPICLSNLTHLEAVSLESEPGFITNALKEASRPTPSGARRSVFTTDRATRRGRPLPAIFGLANRVLTVPVAAEENLMFECNLIPAFARRIADIDLESLHFEGAIIAKQEYVKAIPHLNKGEEADFLTVTCKDGKLGARVRYGISRHQRVIDTVRLFGRFKGKKNEGFAAQASVEFMIRR